MNIYCSTIETLSTKNKYYFWWYSIIIRAKERANTKKDARNKVGYVEAHHILPVSYNMGGKKDNENLVFLTAKEHIMVHRLMCKFISCERLLEPTRKAFHCMTEVDNGGRNKRAVSLHMLAKGREAASLASKGKKRGIQGVPSWFTLSNDMETFKTTLQQHTKDGLSDPKIAELYGVSATTINNWRKKLEINGSKSLLSDRDWLFEHYIINRLSAQEIADIIGCSSTAVQYRLRDHGIAIRDSFERQQNVDKDRRGYFPAKDRNGNRYTIKKDDPRYISGELVGLAKVF